MAEKLSSSGIPGTSYTVTGVDIQAEGVDSNESDHSEESSSNTGLIVGVVVGSISLRKSIVS